MLYDLEYIHDDMYKILCRSDDSDVGKWIGVKLNTKELCFFQEIEEPKRLEAKRFFDDQGMECYYRGLF